MFRPVRQVASPGAKSAVSDCILLNFVTFIIMLKWRCLVKSFFCTLILLYIYRDGEESMVKPTEIERQGNRLPDWGSCRDCCRKPRPDRHRSWGWRAAYARSSVGRVPERVQGRVLRRRPAPPPSTSTAVTRTTAPITRNQSVTQSINYLFKSGSKTHQTWTNNIHIAQKHRQTRRDNKRVVKELGGKAFVPLLRTGLSLMLHTPQQWLPMLFNGPDKPPISSFPWEDLDICRIPHFSVSVSDHLLILVTCYR